MPELERHPTARHHVGLIAARIGGSAQLSPVPAGINPRGVVVASHLDRQGSSLCDGTGDHFYDETMTEDGLMVLADGTVMSRADVVAVLGQARPWVSYEMSDVRIVPIGDDTAALVYAGTGLRGGAEPSSVAVMTSVYVRRDGQWRPAIYEQTSKP